MQMSASPPRLPPPAYLSERLLFSADQLRSIDVVAGFLAQYYDLYTAQGGFYFQYCEAPYSIACHYLVIPFVEPTPDIISLPYDTGSEIAELWQVDLEVHGWYG